MESDIRHEARIIWTMLGFLIGAFLLVQYIYEPQITTTASSEPSTPTVEKNMLRKAETSVSATPAPITKPLPVSTISEGTLTVEQMEAIRADIKSSLYSIYWAEKSFFYEHQRYSTDLKRTIKHMIGEKREFYKIGFLRPYTPEKLFENEDPRNFDSDSYIEEASSGKSYKKSAQKVSLADSGALCERGCTADKDHFEIIASVQLVDGNPPEVWIISDNSEPHQVQDGAAKRM